MLSKMRVKRRRIEPVAGEGVELSILFKELLFSLNPLTFILLQQIQA